MNNSLFKKMNARKHRDIKLLTTERRESHLVSDPNYHKTKRFPEKVSAIEMNKTKLKMTKPAYLDKTMLHGYGQLHSTHQARTLREKCPNTEFFLVRIFPFFLVRIFPYLSVFSPKAGKYRPEKTLYLDTFHAVEDIYTDLAEYVEMRINTSNYEFERPPPIAKNE